MNHDDRSTVDIDELESLDEFTKELHRLRGAKSGEQLFASGGSSARIHADEANVERGLAQLVLSLVELLRQLLEKQAIRRMEAGTLDDDEVERLGVTFMKLQERLDELRDVFGIDEADLNIDLGPLGKLLEDRERRQ